jgi:hypothetical protein
MMLPKNWTDISYEVYKELVEIKKLNLSFTNLYIEVLSLLWDISPDDDIFDMEIDELIKYVKEIDWILKEPIFNKPVKDWNGFRLKNLNKITLGEFIDIENKIVDIDNNLDWICAILYKKCKSDEWNNLLDEPYVYDLDERIVIFNEAPLPLLLTIKTEYFNWRENFMLNYKELFESGEPNEDNDDSDDELVGVENKMAKLNDRKEKIIVKWSWENLLWGLSGEDITKIKNIFELNVIFVFNILSMRKSLS